MSRNVIYNICILIAISAGIVSCFFSLPMIYSLAHTISELFLNMLKLISLPMIFLAIVSTLTQMKNLKEASLLLQKIIKYTLVTTLIAAAVGLTLFIFIEPTCSIKITEPLNTLNGHGGYFSFLKKIIPDNILQPFIESNVLAMAFIATILSIAILKIPQEKSEVVKSFFQGLFEALLKIASALIFLMPIAMFAFTVQFIESISNQKGQLKELLLYGSCVIGANLIQGIIVLPLLLKLKKQSPLKVFKAMLPALITAFFSKSSNGTLPLTLECAQNRLKISEKTSRFSLPLCSVINMNGCAAFILITVLFISTSHGLTFSLGQMILWIFISTLAAVGNAGVPMGCFFLTSTFLVGMGVPLQTMGIILPLYSLFDMVETMLNVWSDCSITTIVDHEIAIQNKKQKAVSQPFHPQATN